ncbi:MAG: DEAD/DEAH box helicase [Gammaproteobacteria bacterium]|nr:DEAD/DEAH box helicase [Gammaproteobacteria bacterium]
MTTANVTAFDQLALHKNIFKVLDEVGYETPSPIQAQTIPLMLEGRDLVGQAQTGTGKTAAFALPILSRLDLKQKQPQVLVLAPTRELAIQVAEAFHKYARHLNGFHVLPVYGGQDYRTQIRALERGVHVVVGTPGRVMDHMRKGNLMLDKLTTLVLDEADEMLRMGFIDDVEWILEQTPPQRQIALFSATMPAQIRRIAAQHLNNPEQVTIKLKTTTAETIRQRFWPVGGLHKLDALTRILEAETFDAMIVFVRTKTATIELAEKLEARGFASAALNGDIQQNQRERTVNNLKNGKLDILVATDVAARGLDVDRVSHVINYDIPYDTEAYVHRIGRTGRAGREGDAILFVAPRERRMLQAIEKATHKKIEMMELPSTDLINNRRIEKFKQRITDTLVDKDLNLFSEMIVNYQQEQNTPLVEIAAALAKLLQGDAPFLLQNKPTRTADKSWQREDKSDDRKPRRERSESRDRDRAPEEGMQRFRIEVGHDHKVKPGNIVGAIANEADIESKYIGRINIFDDYSLLDLPEGMPKELFKILKKTRVMGQALNISIVGKSRSTASSGKDFDKPKEGFKDRKKGKKFAKTDKPAKVKVKKRARDDKDKGKPKRARKKET